jgi:AcrR family transcriptional regulator
VGVAKIATLTENVNERIKRTFKSVKQSSPMTKPNRVPDSWRTGETQSRLLDAAEALFMEHGYEATTLRQITATAGVNLAAVNYHFGGKEGLFQAVLTRRLDPMNQDRLQLLDALEAKAAGKPLTAEQILWAMFLPALQLSRDRQRGGKNFLRLLGRAYVDPAPFMRQFLNERYTDMVTRFKKAFAAALPHLPKQELSWRLHFTLGAMAYTIAGTDLMQVISSLNPRDANNDEMLLRRLLPFLVAGLRAPVPDLLEAKEQRL